MILDTQPFRRLPTAAARISATVIAATVIALASHATAARAGDDSGGGRNDYAGLSCGQLWYERNAIVARHGACFKSSRAIAAFGARCHPPCGRLPAHLGRVVQEISQWGRRRGC